MPRASRRVCGNFGALFVLVSLSLASCVLPGAPGEDQAWSSQAVDSQIKGITFQTVLGGEFLGAQNNGGSGVVADAMAAQAWETFTLYDINNGTLQSGDSVFIQAGNGQYWQAVNAGGSTLNAASNNTLQWETFKVVKQNGSGAIQSGDIVGLQDFGGTWVSAQNGGGGPVYAYGASLGAWEQLRIGGVAAKVVTPPSQPIPIPNVHFRTTQQNLYLGAQNDGGGVVTAVATAAQAWETFTLLDINGGTLQSGDHVFIQAGNGQFFQALNGGGSTLNAASVNELQWETFTVVRQAGPGAVQAGDVVGLQDFGGTWVSAQNGGGGAVYAYGASMGAWETFVFSTGNTGGGAPPVTGPSPPGGTNPPNTPGQPVLPGRGATLNFVEYEAEDMTTDGAQLGPTTTFGQVASEASRRRAVRLSQTGQSVQFTNATDANSIVVRYSIPDGGANYWVTLSVYVNGAFKTHLSLTSRYSWSYGDFNQFNTPAQKDPGQGSAHHFFDEARALIDDVPAGATVMVRKDAGDTAGYYDIDLVDMEAVGPPLGQPAGFLSLTSDCGVAPNVNYDESGAIQNCVNMAQGQGRGLYVPPGSYNSFSSAISVAGLTIRGAGMWHSQIYGYNAHFDCWGNNCQYFDLAVTGDSTIRIDTNTDTAFGGNGSSGVVLDNVWIEHTKTGYWTGPGTNNLTIRNSRIRDTWADGVNLYGGTSNCLITNNHARNTGDDSFAAWSDSGANAGPDHGNVISFNYVQAPWMANCFALYGGDTNSVQDNVCADTVQYPGILLERDFNAMGFTGNTQIQRDTLIRAGAWDYNQPHGALKLNADQGPIQNVNISDIDIVDPTYYGIHVQGGNPSTNVTINNVTISSPGSGAFLLNGGANGWMNVSGITATGSPVGVQDDTGGAFQLVRGGGNSGW
jgi:hypothetical protein